jgi:chemotaxis protein CheD
VQPENLTKDRVKPNGAADEKIMEITVGMGEIKVTGSPSLLRAVGLGSCIAVALYDEETGIGGLAHIMLPHLQKAYGDSLPTRFADVAVGKMIDEMKKQGSRIQGIKAKIFGGANMFPEIIVSNSPMDVGYKNIQAVRDALKRNDIEILVSAVGHHIGRTVIFDTRNGSVVVKAAGLDERRY